MKRQASIKDVERPSPDEIEAMCSSIKSQWTEQQEDERRCHFKGDAASWFVPQFLVHRSESPKSGKGRTIVYRRVQ